MRDEIDETVEASRQAITRSEALMREVRSTLDQGGPAGRDAPAVASAWLARQSAEYQEEARQVRAETLAEIERDLPRQQVTKARAPRRPRQMV